MPGVAPHFTPAHPTDDGFDHPAFEGLERRVFINTVVRLSKKLLLAMHRENLEGRAMQAEMWPASVALQHGFKAVYAPHPVFVDRRWPTGYAGAVFDSSSEASFSIEDGEASSSSSSSSSRQRNDGAEWTEGPDSPYNRDREWNFAGWSWYYASRFPRRIYRAWLGWEVEGDGLPLGREGEAFLENGEGEKSLCLPGMLLHPVKDVRREKVR